MIAFSARQMFIPNPAKPYDSTLSPGKQSNPLARFKARPEPPVDADPQTLALREARCEIQSKHIDNPWQMAIGMDIIAVQGVTGYTEQDPALDFYKLGMNRDEWDKYHPSDVGRRHKDIATRLAIDDSRSLVWTADEFDIKSTKYCFDGPELKTASGHKCDSAGYEGPIALIDNGTRLIRAGKRGLAIWSVDSAPSYRKRGIQSNSTVKFDRPVKKCEISLWAPNPSDPNKSMLCTPGMHTYGVFALDIETGKRASRYYGHGAHVSGFSTTPNDPNVFLTSCHDGGTRLYDVRCAVPSITLSSGQEEANSSVLSASGGGLCEFPVVSDKE